MKGEIFSGFERKVSVYSIVFTLGFTEKESLMVRPNICSSLETNSLVSCLSCTHRDGQSYFLDKYMY